MADESPRGMFLNDKQLVFVFMTATVLMVIVFLCGILVGRGVQTFRGMTPDGTMISAAQIVSESEALPPAGLAAPGPVGVPPAAGTGSEDLTYDRALKGTEPPAPPLATTPTPRPVEPPAVLSDGAPAAEPERPLVVQVTAVRSRTEAETIVARLKRKGYAAFVFAPDGTDGLNYYRVRVGPFDTRREADIVFQRLEREEKYKPWITR